MGPCDGASGSSAWDSITLAWVLAGVWGDLGRGGGSSGAVWESLLPAHTGDLAAPRWWDEAAGLD